MPRQAAIFLEVWVQGTMPALRNLAHYLPQRRGGVAQIVWSGYGFIGGKQRGIGHPQAELHFLYIADLKAINAGAPVF